MLSCVSLKTITRVSERRVIQNRLGIGQHADIYHVKQPTVQDPKYNRKRENELRKWGKIVEI
jgi:RIO-like serine/threonine protein kinase